MIRLESQKQKLSQAAAETATELQAQVAALEEQVLATPRAILQPLFLLLLTSGRSGADLTQLAC